MIHVGWGLRFKVPLAIVVLVFSLFCISFFGILSAKDLFHHYQQRRLDKRHQQNPQDYCDTRMDRQFAGLFMRDKEPPPFQGVDQLLAKKILSYYDG
jgi:hypothetical protein